MPRRPLATGCKAWVATVEAEQVEAHPLPLRLRRETGVQDRAR